MTKEKILSELSKMSYMTLSKSGFSYGSHGRLLIRNLENAWFRDCVTKPPHNVFLTASDKLVETTTYAKNIHADAMPFSLAIMSISSAKHNMETFFPGEENGILNKIAKVVVFNDTKSSQMTFHGKQRERKIWWRKLSRQPSMFVLSEVKKSKTTEAVDIIAKFSFGNVVVESIKLVQDVQKYFQKDMKENLTDTRAVENTAFLDWGCVALLCDSYKDDKNDFKLQIHPRLSPHKATFTVSSCEDDQDSVKEDLKDLISYLNILLRSGGINTLLTYGDQNSNDLQVPFVVNVDKTSLKNGIIHVKSQFTTLEEHVHITKLVEHISSRCF